MLGNISNSKFGEGTFRVIQWLSMTKKNNANICGGILQKKSENIPWKMLWTNSRSNF